MRYKVNWLDKLEEKNKWIGFTLFLDLLNGLSLTLSYLFSPTITMRYPDKEKWEPYPRHRGHHFLNMDENGDNKCVACELCSKICPCNCITVIPEEDSKGNRRPLVYDVNTARCLFCGLCEDACPVDAIALGKIYEYSAYEMKNLYKKKEDLLKPEILGKSERGGEVRKAALVVKGDDVSVLPSDSEGYHWWGKIRRD
jgi:NADH-quinone oxidoreductase subunit I